MNWIFESYSNVYSAAMMQDLRKAPATGESPVKAKSFSFKKLFRRG